MKLSEKQFAEVKSGVKTVEEIVSTRQKNAEVDKAVKELKDSTNNSKTVGDTLLVKQDDGTVKKVSLKPKVPTPKLTGYVNIDNQIISENNTKITKAISDVTTLARLGKIPLDEANTQISELKRLYMKKPSQVTKLKVKGLSKKAIRIPKTKVKKLKAIKFPKPKSIKTSKVAMPRLKRITS